MSVVIDDEYFQERAAIMEYDGGCTREEAERWAEREERQKLLALARYIVKQEKIEPGFGRRWFDNARPAVAEQVRAMARDLWSKENATK